MEYIKNFFSILKRIKSLYILSNQYEISDLEHLGATVSVCRQSSPWTLRRDDIPDQFVIMFSLISTLVLHYLLLTIVNVFRIFNFSTGSYYILITGFLPENHHIKFQKIQIITIIIMYMSFCLIQNKGFCHQSVRRHFKSPMYFVNKLYN